MTTTHTFKALDRWVEVETNELGTHVVVKFDDHVIEESTGESIWLGLDRFHSTLRGAARKAAENKVLRGVGETAIRDFIEFHSEYIEN